MSTSRFDDFENEKRGFYSSAPVTWAAAGSNVALRDGQPGLNYHDRHQSACFPSKKVHFTTRWLGPQFVSAVHWNVHLHSHWHCFFVFFYRVNFEYRASAHWVPRRKQQQKKPKKKTTITWSVCCWFCFPIAFPSSQSWGACHRVHEFKSPGPRLHNCTISVCSPAGRRGGGGGGGERSSQLFSEGNPGLNIWEMRSKDVSLRSTRCHLSGWGN